MPTVTADLILNHDLYAKGNVSALDYTFKNVAQNFLPGDYIGNVYSYLIANNGKIYWMVYLSDADFKNQNASYIEHNPGLLSVPDLPGILQKIADEQKKKEIQDNGVISYYLGKYLPYIVIAGVIAILLPSITKSIKK